MVWLGIWQLHRADWKAELLRRYDAALAMSADVPFPREKEAVEGVLYRHSSLDCARVLSIDAVSGRNDKGAAGWAHVARCALDGGAQADVVLGWSNGPEGATWGGGKVTGIIGPGRDGEARLVAAPPLAGLAANAAPDPADIPNNHLAYAGQWFFFAATALVIYVLALRRKWKGIAR